MECSRCRNNPELTRRQVEVIAVVLRGHTRLDEMAAALVVEKKTVQTHLIKIHAKLGARNLADIVLMALGRKQGLIDISGIDWEEVEIDGRPG